jgi:hypothetical protein
VREAKRFHHGNRKERLSLRVIPARLKEFGYATRKATPFLAIQVWSGDLFPARMLFFLDFIEVRGHKQVAFLEVNFRSNFKLHFRRGCRTNAERTGRPPMFWKSKSVVELGSTY